MTIELLIAPPAAGKTEKCVERIRSLLLEHPCTSIRVVVPDRLQAAAFRRRLAEAGGAIGVQVGTFGDLYRNLLDRASQPVPVASQPIVHRLVHSAIEQVAASGGLSYYAELRSTPGFALTLCDAFTELKRALVFPEDFVTYATTHSPALQELARLYQAYQTNLQNFGWADPDGLSWLAVEALQKHPELAGCLALLVVDGFDSFSGAQLTALQLLEPTGAQILITLPGEQPFQRSAHRRFASAYQSLVQILPVTVHRLGSRTFLPAPIQHLEANLFEPHATVMEPGVTLQLLEARSPAEEAREALRWLKARCMRDGIKTRECAIVTPNPDLYNPYLRQSAAEFGLPLFFTQGEMLAQAPIISALLDLLNLPVMNYPRRLILDAIRSPFFNLSPCGLKPQHADQLDEISRLGQVIEGRDQWVEVFDLLEQANEAIEIEVDEEQNPLPTLHKKNVRMLRQGLEQFLNRLQPPAEQRSITRWIHWLEDLLDEWQYHEQAVDEQEKTALEKLRETLRALVLGEGVTGSSEIDYPLFITELHGSLASVGYQEPLPRGQPAILVAKMLEARGIRFQAVAILGLSEGIFPTNEREDPFLNEALRSELKLESRLEREQRGLFYQAITRSDNFLLLTRPYLADDGEKWEASPYWKAVQALLPDNNFQHVRPDDPRPLCEAASPEEALFWAIRQGSLPGTYADLQPRWETLQHARQVLQARRAPTPAGPYEGMLESLAGEIRQRFSDKHIWSASRLETYGACPHQFLIQHALGLQAKGEPELGVNAAQLGTILHAILEKAYAAVADPLDTQSVQAVLPELAHQEFTIAPHQLGFRPTPLWQIEQEQLIQVLMQTIQGLAELDPDARWRPFAYEQAFDFGDQPLLMIPIDGQTVRLHGVIDRIDRAEDGRLRIIDYKTGSSHLDKADLTSGRRLQLPLYALAAQKTLNLGKPADGLYWSLLAGKAGGLRLQHFEYAQQVGPQAAIEMAIMHIHRIVLGIQQANFPPLPPKGGCPQYCPAVTWCWRYRAGYIG